MASIYPNSAGAGKFGSRCRNPTPAVAGRGGITGRRVGLSWPRLPALMPPNFTTVTTLAAAAASAAAGPFVAGLLLGVGAAVPPGPVNLEIARRATRGGMFAGAAVGFGAVTVDVVLALLLSLGVLALIDRTPLLRLPISLVGVLLLGYLGFGALRNFVRGWRSKRADAMDAATSTDLDDKPTPLRGYATGLLICGTSPYQAAFWLTGVPAILARSGHPATNGRAAAGRLALCAGVFAATLTWVVCFSSLVAFARSLDRRRVAAAGDGSGRRDAVAGIRRRVGLATGGGSFIIRPAGGAVTRLRRRRANPTD